MTTCEARLGWQAVEWGEAPRYCRQTVGLRTLVAADGSQHRYCPKLGHRERVEAQVRRLTGAAA